MSHDMETIERLGEEVAVALGSGPSEERRILQRRDFLAVVTEDRSSRRGWYLTAAGTAAAVLISLVLYKNQTEPAPLPFYVGDTQVAGVDGQWIRTQLTDMTIRFEDGSNFSLSANASARMLRADMKEVRLDLASGKVRCNVNKKTGALWQVAAGPYTITVTGTIFDAAWDSSEAILDVTVVRGSVLVTGADLSEHGVRLAVGDRLHADADRAVISQKGRLGDDSPTLDALRSDLGEEPETGAPPKGEGSKAVAAPVQRRRIRGGPSEPAKMNLSEIWRAANKARYNRDAATAESLLFTLKERFPKSREADAATFLMGRIRLELRRDPSGSVRWFKQYLRDAPNGPLAEEALGRIVDAYKRAGGRRQAKQYAEKYLKKYPDGLFADLAQSVVADERFLHSSHQ